MTRLIDPVLLRTLAAVVRSRSFSRAAEQLGLGQSTVSQHVQRLEAQLGHRLVARDTHSVALTPEGETVLGFARTVLDAHEWATDPMVLGTSVAAALLRQGARQVLDMTETYQLAPAACPVTRTGG